MSHVFLFDICLTDKVNMYSPLRDTDNLSEVIEPGGPYLDIDRMITSSYSDL